MLSIGVSLGDVVWIEDDTSLTVVRDDHGRLRLLFDGPAKVERDKRRQKRLDVRRTEGDK